MELGHTTHRAGIRETFTAHHARLEQLFEDMTAALRVGDPVQARQAWSVLDQELTEHMALEEQELLPRFARVDPKTAAALRADHAEFRRLLDEMGTGVDLRRISEPVAEAFFDRLRSHAAHEDSLLYRWADRTIPGGRMVERLARYVGRSIGHRGG